jgi:HEAT repeat protein
MPPPPPRSDHAIEQIIADLRSADQMVRCRAMQDLLRQVRSNPKIHREALAIFREYLLTAPDAWTATTAASGIEHIVGSIDARATWLSLLNSENDDLSAGTAMVIADPFYVPALLHLRQTRENMRLRKIVIRALGRLRDSVALPVLLEQLANPTLRPFAVEALGDLGDLRAIEHLEPLLSDRTEAWLEDNHGPMLNVNDLADAAIRHIRQPTPTARPAAPLSNYGMRSNRAIRAGGQFRPACLVAVAAAILQVPWLALSMLTRPGPLQPDLHHAGLFAFLPAALGLPAGIGMFLRLRPLRPAEAIYLIAGCLACGVFWVVCVVA